MLDSRCEHAERLRPECPDESPRSDEAGCTKDHDEMQLPPRRCLRLEPTSSHLTEQAIGRPVQADLPALDVSPSRPIHEKLLIFRPITRATVGAALRTIQPAVLLAAHGERADAPSVADTFASPVHRADWDFSGAAAAISEPYRGLPRFRNLRSRRSRRGDRHT
jgi:hypothetical protein